MVRAGIGIVVGVLLAGTAAQAQTITNLTTSAGTDIVFPFSPPLIHFGQTGSPPPPGTFTDPSANHFGGSDFTSFVTNSGGSVSFESSNVVSGHSVQSYSNTSVGFSFTNDGSSPVQFDSLITAAGLGFYLADVTGGCQYSNCAEVSGVSLLDLTRFIPLGSAGEVGFDFSIQDNGRDLFRVSGSSAITYVGGNAQFSDNFGSGVYGDGSGAMGLLKGFTLASGQFDSAAHGFAWDATPVSFFLGEGVHNLTYNTKVYSTSNANALDCGASLVSYSGFGDPIGRGGGVEALTAFSRNDSSFAATSSGCPADGPIKGLNFTPTTFDPPILKDGVLTYDPPGNAVPEPATWAMMIMGFGGIGAALRRRRFLGATA
jgi:hypothetical protein